MHGHIAISSEICTAVVIDLLRSSVDESLCSAVIPPFSHHSVCVQADDWPLVAHIQPEGLPGCQAYDQQISFVFPGPVGSRVMSLHASFDNTLMLSRKFTPAQPT